MMAWMVRKWLKPDDCLENAENEGSKELPDEKYEEDSQKYAEFLVYFPYFIAPFGYEREEDLGSIERRQGNKVENSQYYINQSGDCEYLNCGLGQANSYKPNEKAAN
jgi:hypothetical protein